MNTSPQTARLPPLRNGITFAFNDYDIEGKPQWLIHDASCNRFFLIGWLEHEILSRWHLGTPGAILDAIATETTLQVEMGDIENFYKFLASHFLLKQSGYQILGQAKQQNLFRNENILQWLIGHYLFFRIPLYRPDAFLVKTAAIGRALFSRTTVWIMTALALIALYQLGERWDTFTHTFPSVFTPQGLFFYMIAFSVCKLLHELGHAYMCRSYGVPVPSLGVAFLVFWPVLYTDTTLSWSLTSHQRLRIAIAGIWTETYVTIIAALIWCNTSILTLQSICYLVISVHWMASLLINVSPFMRFDGYYVLADILRMPNLQPRAFALTRWQIRHWLFHWPDPPPEKFGTRLHVFLVTYSIVTWLYRLVLYAGIAALVYRFFIKIGGIILFIIEMYYFILGPFINEARYWAVHREKFSLNWRTRITLLTTIFLSIFLLLPVSQTLRLPATISYYHQVIYAPESGILQTPLPPDGTAFKKGGIIASMYSPWLEEAMREILLDYYKTLNELRRSEVNQNYSPQKNILLSSISKQRSEYAKLQFRREKLIYRAPFDGRLAEAPPDLLSGITVQKDEWLGDLVDPGKIQVEAYVSETDLGRIHTGDSGHFYPMDLDQPSLPVTVKSIEILNAHELHCHFSSAAKENRVNDPPLETPCYHISEFGGDIAVFLTDSGSYVPVNSVYLVTLQTDSSASLAHIGKGSVLLNAKPISLMSRLFYKIKKIWIEQSGF